MHADITRRGFLRTSAALLAGAAGRRIAIPGAARYMEAASGLLIALLGVVFQIAGHG